MSTRPTPDDPALARQYPLAEPGDASSFPDQAQRPFPRERVFPRPLARPAEPQPARLDALFASAPVPLACLDSLGRIRDLNLAGAALLGSALDALRDAPLTMWMEPGEVEGFFAHLLAVLERGGRQTLDGRLRDRLGGHRDVRLISTRHGEGPNPLCLTAILDITEQRRGEERLRRGDAFGNALLRALPMEAAVLDRSGLVVAVNEGWQRSARQGGAEVRLTVGIGLDFVRTCRQAVRQAGDSGEVGAALGGVTAVLSGASPSFALEYGETCPEGPRWFSLTAIALPEPIGGALLTRTEVTALKVAEDTARRWEAGPAHAARVNAVGALSCALIHELAQPLATLGFSGDTALTLMRSGAATPEQVIPLLERIDAQATRAGELVRRLRGFMRRGTAEKGPIDLVATLHEGADLVRPQLAEKRVELILEVPTGPVAVLADQIQVEQVLVNLVNNAIEAMEQAGSPRREVRVQLGWAGDACLVTVRDTGPGLAAGRYEQVFDAFETGKPSGLGMGLAISRTLIQGHGGHLWADPDASGGAAFHFTLPAGPTP